MARRDIELEKRVSEDREAFKGLYEINHNRIFNYFLFSTGDAEVSLDLTSETFLRALRALNKYDYRRASFVTWLYAIASRELKTFYRKRSRSKTFSMSVLGIVNENEDARNRIYGDEIQRAQATLQQSEDHVTLMPLLRKLRAADRLVFFLKYFEGRSSEEIADLLGVSAGTVRSQVHRGLKQLRCAMEISEGNSNRGKRRLETPIAPPSLQEEVD